MDIFYTEDIIDFFKFLAKFKGLHLVVNEIGVFRNIIGVFKCVLYCDGRSFRRGSLL